MADTKDKKLTVGELETFAKKSGITFPTATTFVPTFNNDVFVQPPPVQVNPHYCATIECGVDLMEILKDLGPVGYLDWPSPFAPGSPFYFTQKVPWIVFSNGAVRNAGLLAVYWLANSGDPGGLTAEKNARLDIAWG